VACLCCEAGQRETSRRLLWGWCRRVLLLRLCLGHLHTKSHCHFFLLARQYLTPMIIKGFPVSTAVGTMRCLSIYQHCAGPHHTICNDGGQPPCVTWAGLGCSWQRRTWILSFSHDGSSGLGASLGFAGPEPACFCAVNSLSSHILPPDASLVHGHQHL
jgi:hypothetical protein